MEQFDLDGSDRFCIFQCHDQWYGIPAIDVRGVSPRPAIRSVPNSDPVLSGISHLHNEFVPIVSMRALSRISYEQDSNSEQQLLTLPGPPGAWGILIDQVITLASLEVSISSFGGPDDQWSKVMVGSASFRHQIVQIVDARALYEYAASLLDRFWQDTQTTDAQLLVS